ncbi:MAG: hypothetical protein A2X13_11540 [Bacteroidetes bacterium GWC2_33_15]|nr:MAG: hypothetical protein A2X10_05565 [Bacteroidetes bacterium GWA2_33_15]OFX50772.1 MAG: hypothetical protein A2X13_11540 [Bacteroidetes bacterium GWC2_33_15]OFX62945.1 MAG: hypothetical protein A2X15_09830 [Bacteroidetes bacterium GWB2_32_14]OFX70014.1 MAG: hypothetical protein A2X14_02690 [Bacteroidetes bacterium GWD2_33_33]HAN19013.1 hypothetical protein [Bacteroidales bacterium]
MNNNNQLKNQKNMKTVKVLITGILLFAISLGVKAQEEKKKLEVRPFQITFVTPLGTNGLEAWNITNKFSINLYAGYNGGLDGVELSGFGSMLKNNMKGAQISGFGNMTMGTGKGAQVSGYFNYTKGYFSGVQVSGFSNIITNDAKAWQISGFGNVTTKKLDGAQIASFANYSNGITIGQASGFASINKGDLSGVQISGFANINTGSLKGAQISGFANITQKLNGVQIGVFNYVDSLEKGIPIGFFTIVKNGYRAIEISGNETMYGNVSFKTGTKQFYNIISVGGSYKDNKILWGLGYGIGTMLPIKENWNLGIELLSYQINEDEWHTEALNLYNKLQLTASRKVTKNMDIFGGLSWNVNVSETEDRDGNPFESSVSPYTLFDKTYGNGNHVTMYPGFTVGIRF